MKHGDCLKVLGTPFSLATDLIIWDPPYNLGKKYDAYKDDNKKLNDYLRWFVERLAVISAYLRPGGAMFLFINDALVSELDMEIKSFRCPEVPSYRKKSHIVWHYTFGQNHQANFTPSHTHILYYVHRGGQETWNGDAIRHPSARQLKYADKRANPKGRLPDNTWVLFPEQLPEAFKPSGDTWLASRVCGTFKERKRHSPNQLPVALVRRIVEVTTNPGDIVLDPMCGTGTVGAVCKGLGRSFIGMDISETCVAESKERIKSVKSS